MSHVPLGFIPESLTVPLDRILLSRKTPVTITGSHKFKQIKASIEEVGLIEPLSVAAVPRKTDQYLLLDGHVRLIALKDLGWNEAPCLVAKTDETYTFNARVNRLSTIQEHIMIKRAIEKGVPKERLAKALSVNIDNIVKRFTLLDGICLEAADLLQDRNFSPDLSRVLRKMKPKRQVECVELMAAANSVTVSYAEALLVATPAEMLVDEKKPEKMQGVSKEQMLKMEKELATVQAQYKLIEHTYSKDNLELTLARGYLEKLLGNKLVTKQLRQKQPEFLEQFQSIIETTSLEVVGQATHPS